MSPSDCKAAVVREWLTKAEGDLAAAKTLEIAGNRDNALYHAQQCAEKSWKAFLTWNDQPFRRTHDLEELGAACAALDASLVELAKESEALTDFAWRLRYPGDPYVIADGEVEAMIRLAAAVLAQVQARIPEPARPTQGESPNEPATSEEPTQ